jgi:predicted dehydrogenase
VQTTARYRCAIAGLSSDHVWPMGDGLAAQPDADVVAAADGNAALRDKAARRWNLDRTYATAEELLARESLDAVLVCSDNASKAAITEAAAGRGVHVYLDKPMAATADQARRISAAARDGGVRLMVAYHHVFNPLYEELSLLLRNGALGTIYLARGSVGHAGPRELGCSEDFCAWLFDARRGGGGSFADEGCYLLTEFVDRMGPITEVSAFTAQIGHRGYLPPDIEDNSVAILRFASGALGLIDAKWGQAGPPPALTTYHGVDGTLATFAGRAELALRRPAEPGLGWQPVELSGDVRTWRRDQPRPADAGWDGREQRQFLTALASGSTLDGPAGPVIALHVQEVVEAAYASAQTGRAVSVPT